MAERCQGTTTSGDRCARRTNNASGYCNRHNDSEAAEAAEVEARLLPEEAEAIAKAETALLPKDKVAPFNHGMWLAHYAQAQGAAYQQAATGSAQQHHAALEAAVEHRKQQHTAEGAMGAIRQMEADLAISQDKHAKTPPGEE